MANEGNEPRRQEKNSAWGGQMRDNVPKNEEDLRKEERGEDVVPERETPYEPQHKGFDPEATARAQDTADRSRESAAGPRGGEYADETYVEGGPQEAARRRGQDESDVEEGVERAAKK